MTEDDLLWIFRLFILPLFISYLFAADYLIWCHMYRQAFTIWFLAETLTIIVYRKKITEALK